MSIWANFVVVYVRDSIDGGGAVLDRAPRNPLNVAQAHTTAFLALLILESACVGVESNLEP